MANNFQNLGADAALQAAQAVTTHVSTTPNAWGITSSELSILNDGHDDLQNAIDAQTNAMNAMKAATRAKAQALDTLVAGLSAAAKSAYATPTVTDTMLAQIGFSPRQSGGSKPKAIPAPTSLVANGFADGTARIAWARNGNAQGTIFSIETSADGVNFTLLKATTRASLLVDGFAPGVPAWFRVTASRGALTSPTSTSASIYAPGLPARPALKLAA